MPYGKSHRGTPEEIAHRRGRIKKWVMEEGITNREEIRRRLIAEGITVSRPIIYNDFKEIAAISEGELREFELDVMGIFRKLIRDLETMIAVERDFSKKAQLIRTLSQVMKDRHTVASNIATHGKPESKQHREDDNVNITFG